MVPYSPVRVSEAVARDERQRLPLGEERTLQEKIKEQPIESQIKIESRDQELTRQKLRLEKQQLKLRVRKGKGLKQREVVIFGKSDRS